MIGLITHEDARRFHQLRPLLIYAFDDRWTEHSRVDRGIVFVLSDYKSGNGERCEPGKSVEKSRIHTFRV
ncbi:hypothetical protein PBY51_005964 [Eleginops maclovinus]|uniref:Uncharacterized protein n=1 Tax=Eleginops maclovinus TaxID=56733 RepID=A0AAN7WTB3_ELEMC|nr:hypothetical protein PBY51_005964 [Eleginops maclovinus]